ncbi:major facilitator superfamily domain-containing protein [Lophiotrema nucula]|uniref:Major facilitator superfamily domain-containing protein n=1 Tax=Lophiotrema nucula TaxID=690887 RepID=A0A6A5YN64_9PLEO|nr:major facilitator superfamily domain-containing protein [Lophiotrema nucula]
MSTDPETPGGRSSTLADLPNNLDPHQWPQSRKLLFVTIVCYADGLTFLISMMLAASLSQITQTFHPPKSHDWLVSFAVTVYILGFATGPLILAPLTDFIGRVWILRLTSLVYLIFTVACGASTSLEMLVAMRFFAGAAGGAPVAIGPAVVCDMYPRAEQEKVIAWCSASIMLAPALGPILGGAITGWIGWRWMFWIAGMLAGVCVALMWVLKETHGPTLLRNAERKIAMNTEKKRKSALSKALSSWRDQSISLNLRRAISNSITISSYAPSFAILFSSLVSNGLGNIILSSLATVFQTAYAFSPAKAGLSYLGLAAGEAFGLAVSPPVARFLIKKLQPQVSNAEIYPQHTLPAMAIGGCVASLGLVLYGWTCKARLHWIIPILSLGLFNMGYMGFKWTTQMYLINAVPGFTGSGLGAHTVFHSVGGAFIPMPTFAMYSRIGYGWGNSVVALLHLILSAVPFAMYIKSRQLQDEWVIRLGKEHRGVDEA